MQSSASNLIRRIVKASKQTSRKRSTESRSERDEEILYNRLTTTVTASWLEIEQNSYAVRHLRKLSRYSSSPPRLEAGIVFFLAVALSVWQILRIADETPPMALNWILLVLCVVLVFGASFVCFCMRSTYRLDVMLANETKPLQIECITRADLEELNDALLRAMDYYRGNVLFEPDSPMVTKELA